MAKQAAAKPKTAKKKILSKNFYIPGFGLCKENEEVTPEMEKAFSSHVDAHFQDGGGKYSKPSLSDYCK